MLLLESLLSSSAKEPEAVLCGEREAARNLASPQFTTKAVQAPAPEIRETRERQSAARAGWKAGMTDAAMFLAARAVDVVACLRIVRRRKCRKVDRPTPSRLSPSPSEQAAREAREASRAARAPEDKPLDEQDDSDWAEKTREDCMDDLPTDDGLEGAWACPSRSTIRWRSSDEEGLRCARP